MSKTKKILLIQLGSPKSLKTKDVRSYLREFLSDPRVVDLNPFVWKIILNLFILPFRPSKISKAYANIWDGKEFQLIKNTREFTEKLGEKFSDYDVEVAYILSKPRVSEILASWELLDIEDLIIVPLFPQYSEATTASVFDVVSNQLHKQSYIPPFSFLNSFHRSKAFIESSAQKINQHLASNETDHLVISFHGVPKRRVLFKEDPYYKHCLETYELIREYVNFDRVSISFQSRFGSEEWLGPYTDQYVQSLVKQGQKKVAVYCPSFVVDCLETTVEIGIELQEEVEEFGGEVSQIPCLNTDSLWVNEFSDYIKAEINNNEKPEFKLSKEKETQIEEKMQAEKNEVTPPLSPEAKGTIKIVFFTLFLDLIGFSIIFPLFPALAKYYLEFDGDNYFLKLIFNWVNLWSSQSSVDGNLSMSSIVLFGGALGALYSFLQFLAAPVWGGISDRIGRKPVLLISVFFLGVSYLLWAISGSFTLLIFSRFIGGIMGGNISTATAVIADVTISKNRSKGMAFVGIAFAFGFILGPALGGILSMVDLTAIYPVLKNYGFNPFSAPALLAGALSFINLYFIATKFKETLPVEKRGTTTSLRSSNPIKLFKPLPYEGVNLTNFAHFLFLLAFSGMEFTLTFLAVERLSFTSMDNAYMFIFIGVVIALVQGGVVRRKASQVGEKKMALIGLITIIPGLILIGITQSLFPLYAGLFFLATGSAMAIPCLTSLVSLYSPSQEQGRSIGIFRSLGALSRVVGPIVASLVYWRYGSAIPYFAGVVVLIIPIMLVSLLPKPQY